MLTQAAVGLPFESCQPSSFPGPRVPSPGRCSIPVTKPPGLHTPAPSPVSLLCPKAGAELFALKGSTPELLARFWRNLIRLREAHAF